jgi:S-adenosylmethionine hydrolase
VAGPTITFLSDYGSTDEFAGVVRSVLRRLAPAAALVDLCHDLPAHDVRAGALMLARAAPFLAPGVVLGVVDPGVGGRRRGLALEVEGERGLHLVGPDNGLLVPAAAALGGVRLAVELARPDSGPTGAFGSAGPTFDGRDLFAPAVAGLCRGEPLPGLGQPVDSSTLVPGPALAARREGEAVVTEVAGADRFGNLELGANAADVAHLGERLVVEVGPARAPRVVRRVHAFSDLEEGELGALVDSSGLLSLVKDRQPASLELGAQPGDPVRIWPAPSG